MHASGTALSRQPADDMKDRRGNSTKSERCTQVHHIAIGMAEKWLFRKALTLSQLGAAQVTDLNWEVHVQLKTTK